MMYVLESLGESRYGLGQEPEMFKFLSRKSDSQSSSTPEALRQLGEIISELTDLEEKLGVAAAVAKSDAVVSTFDEIDKIVQKMERAWSGSWLGYQSRVYIQGMAPKGPEDFFDSDWGMDHPAPWRGSRGNWVLVDSHEVREKVLGHQDVIRVLDMSDLAMVTFDEAKCDALAIADALLSVTTDKIVQEMRGSIASINAEISASDFIDHMMPKQYRTHDLRAVQEGPQIPPHKEIAAQIYSAKSRWHALESLAREIVRLKKYLQRRARLARANLGAILSGPEVDIAPGQNGGYTPGSIQAGGNVTIVSESKGANTIAGTFRLTEQSQLSQSPQGGDKEPLIARDVFEHDVAEILSLLIDAKEDLEADYENVRRALRKLNVIEVEQEEQLSTLRGKLDAELTENDKSALRKFSETASSVGINIVSSGIWSYVIEPLIRSI